MIRHTDNAHEGWGFEDGDKSLVAMPLFHVGGSSYILFSIFDGVPSVMTREPDGGSLAWAIMNGANRTFLVPAVLAQVLQSGADAVKLFGALKTYTYGAAPMPTPLLRAAMEAWPDTEFMQVYGLTEVCRRHHAPAARGAPATPTTPSGCCRPAPCCPRPSAGSSTSRRGEDVPVGAAGRAVVPDPAADEGLPRQGGGDRQGHHRGRLVPHRRHRADGRGRLRLRRGPAQGHDHLGRGEHLLPRGRAGARPSTPRSPRSPSSASRTRRGARSSEAVVGLKPGATATEEEHHRLLPASGWRSSSARARSTSCAALPRNPTGKILKKDLRAPHWEGRDRSIV